MLLESQLSCCAPQRRPRAASQRYGTWPRRPSRRRLCRPRRKFHRRGRDFKEPCQLYLDRFGIPSFRGGARPNRKSRPDG
eukprot:4752202-Pleurochrysis_carterae.AAC.1